MAARTLGKGPDFEKTTFDKPSVALCSVGLVALLYGLSSFTKSESRLLVVTLIVGGIALLAVALVDAAVVLFCIRERAGAGAGTAAGAGEKAAADMRAAADAQAATGMQGATEPAAASGAELVSDVMNRQPSFVATGSTLRSVAKTPIETHTSGVPVVDRDRRVVGFVSDGDLLKYLGTENRDLLDASLMMYRFSDPESFGQRARQLLDLGVESVMTRSVVAVEQNMPLGKACALLADKRIKKVPVVDAAGTLVGTLSRGNVVRSALANLVTATE